MPLKNLSLTLLVGMSLLSCSMSAHAQSDAELFAQGRVAFDNYKDCTAAEKALLSVTSEGQSNPLWISYMARTEECLGKLPQALTYYERYNQVVPGQVDIINKLADLRYRVGKANDAARATEHLRQAGPVAESVLAAAASAINKLGVDNTTIHAVADAQAFPCMLKLEVAETSGGVRFVNAGADLTFGGVAIEVKKIPPYWVFYFKGPGVSALRWATKSGLYDPGSTEIDRSFEDLWTFHDANLGGFPSAEEAQAVLNLLNEANRICKVP